MNLFRRFIKCPVYFHGRLSIWFVPCCRSFFRFMKADIVVFSCFNSLNSDAGQVALYILEAFFALRKSPFSPLSSDIPHSVSNDWKLKFIQSIYAHFKIKNKINRKG